MNRRQQLESIDFKNTAEIEELEDLRKLDEQQAEDRAEISCARCGYWPCVCGDPEFEQWVSQELNHAAEVE